jgi:hypothetical protein
MLLFPYLKRLPWKTMPYRRQILRYGYDPVINSWDVSVAFQSSFHTLNGSAIGLTNSGSSVKAPMTFAMTGTTMSNCGVIILNAVLILCGWHLSMKRSLQLLEA